MEPYSAHSIERALREGDVLRGLSLGWQGSFVLHRLVQHGDGERRVRLEKRSRSIGLDLCNERGVALVRSIHRSAAAAIGDEIRPGDVVRSVDGQVYFTCEAVVEVLRSHRKGEISLGLLRAPAAASPPPEPSADWSEAGGVQLRAGENKSVAFAAPGPAVLQYSFRAAAHDICFRVTYVGELDAREPAAAGGSGLGRGRLLDVRAGSREGSLALPNGGRYVAALDNSHSLLRSKDVSFELRLLRKASVLAAERRGASARLETELDGRAQRAAELARHIAITEPKLAALRKQLGEVEATLQRARVDQRENERLLREGQLRLAALQGGGEGKGGGAAVGARAVKH